MSDGPDVGGLDSGGGMGFDGDFDHGFDSGAGGLDGIDGGDEGGGGGEIIADALLVGFDHCDLSGCSLDSESTNAPSFSIGNSGNTGLTRSIMDRSGIREKQNELSEKQKALVSKAACDPQRRIFGLHVVSHGPCDTFHLISQVGKKLNLSRFDGVTPNFPSIDDFQTELADWNLWSPPYPRLKLPHGYYRGATGTTRVIRQNWQVKQKLPWYRRWSKPSKVKYYDRFQNTYLEVRAVQWYYREIGDFETRININVASLTMIDKNDNQWGYLKVPFQWHQEAARQMSAQILDCLKACQPSQYVKEARRQVKVRGTEAIYLGRQVSDNPLLQANNQKVSPSSSGKEIPGSSGLNSGSCKSESQIAAIDQDEVKVVVRLPVRQSS